MLFFLLSYSRGSSSTYKGQNKVSACKDDCLSPLKCSIIELHWNEKVVQKHTVIKFPYLPILKKLMLFFYKALKEKIRIVQVYKNIKIDNMNLKTLKQQNTGG